MFKARDHAHFFDQVQDNSRIFPQEIFDYLKRLDLLSIALPHIFGAKDDFNESSQGLLDLLFELGRGDLSVGRIFEGHINALLLIDTFGTSAQKEKYFAHAAQGKLFGVWNTETGNENLKIKEQADNLKLMGTKSFCTGALNLQFAIITAKNKRKIQMLVVPLNHTTLKEDWSVWNPIGMRATVSCRIDFLILK